MTARIVGTTVHHPPHRAAPAAALLRRAAPLRWARLLSVTALLPVVLMFAGVLLAGCMSHEQRWGRDPATLTQPADPARDPRMRMARSKASLETDRTDDVSPVDIMFVNQDPITTDDILMWTRPELQKWADTLPPDEYQAKAIDICKRQIRSAVDTLLLYQLARRRMPKEQLDRIESFVDGRIRDIINKQHGGRQSRYEQALKKRGIRPDQDRERIRREMVVLAYLQSTVRPRVADPTRREVLSYYEKYKKELRAKQRRSMRLIDIPIGDTDALGDRLDRPITHSQARRTCQAALDEIRAGASFAEVARKYSFGINAVSGGDWGVVTRDGMRRRWLPAVEALYTLGDGQVSDVIETDQACFVVKCTHVDKPVQKSFTELQAQLIERYKDAQFDLLVREVVADLHAKAHIRPENPGRFLRAVVNAAPRPATRSSVSGL